MDNIILETAKVLVLGCSKHTPQLPLYKTLWQSLLLSARMGSLLMKLPGKDSGPDIRI